jgi:hypothetical protein
MPRVGLTKPATSPIALGCVTFMEPNASPLALLLLGRGTDTDAERAGAVRLGLGRAAANARLALDRMLALP